MKQAIRLFGHEEPLSHPGMAVYKCSECSLRFEIEHTAAGPPRCCPSCCAIYTITEHEQAEQLARLAVLLNTDPSTLLWMLRIFAGMRDD